jgi:tetratricopeptide (TPR) repeat protein
MNEDSIFLEALQQGSPDARAAFLDQACAGNAELRDSIERLLRAHERAENVLPAKAPGLPVTAAVPVAERPGVQIGPYKLLEQIGEGGFGVVYMAEQLEPVRRKVALKLIKPGMDTRQVIARFDAERQALAVMDHLNIAHVLDAGTTESGRPYFVMELVRGIPITLYCDENQLPIRERLELFATVCQAIQHAHTKGIIHRDIKPTNVLVTRQDGQPLVKVIDFGVAKAMGQQLTEKTLFTEFAQMIGTPLYMSPEQAELSSTDIDTRSDIYSLGVLLYELLTGTTPVSKEQLKQAAFDEIRRIIREEEPPKPSTRISTGDAAPSIAAQRHTEPAKLTKLVRGELDWIVMKALDKDRNRRYETASGFARDVQRYLNDEQVQACPPSTWYRYRKFARRNKIGLTIAMLVLFFLVLLGSGVGWAVRDRAARHAKVAGEVESILAEVDELEREQKWPEALAAARRAEAAVAGGEADAATVQRVRERLKDLEFIDRLEQIRMHRATWVEGRLDYAGAEPDYAQAFRDYGVDALELPVETSIDRLKARPALAIPLALALDEWVVARRAISEQDAGVRERLVPVARGIDPDPLRDWLRSTWVQPDSSEWQDELHRLAQSIDIRAQHPSTLVRIVRGFQRAKDSDAAVRLLRDAQRVYPGDFWLNFELAVALRKINDHEEAVRFYTAALAIRPDSTAALNNLGNALKAQKRLDEAITCYRKAIELDPKLAPAHDGLGCLLCDDLKDYDKAIEYFRKAIALGPKRANSYRNLGNALVKQNRLDEAIAFYKQAIELDPKYADAYNNLGNVLVNQNRLDEAIAFYKQAIELDPKDVRFHFALCSTLQAMGKPDEAIAFCKKAIELDPKNAQLYDTLGYFLRVQHKQDEEIAAYQEGFKLDPKNARFPYMLGSILRDQGKLDEAIAAFQKAIELDPNNAGFHHNLGYALSLHGKLDEAIAAFQESIRLRPDFAHTHYKLGNTLRKQNKFDEAIACYKRAIELEPKLSSFHMALGYTLAAKGMLDEAVACFQRALELDPHNHGARQGLGGVLEKQGKLHEAVALYHQGLDLGPDTGKYYHGPLGGALQQVNPEEAISRYRERIERRPDDASSHWGLGVVLEKQDKLDEATTCYHRAVELSPRESYFCNSLGTALYRARRWKEAIETLQRADQLRGGNYNAFFIAMAHWQLGNKAEARRWYDQAAQWMDENKPKYEGLRRFREEAAELMGIEEKKD